MTPEELNERLLDIISENRRLQRHINVQMMTILSSIIERLDNNELDEAMDVLKTVHALYVHKVAGD